MLQGLNAQPNLQPEPEDTRIDTGRQLTPLETLFKTLSGNPQGYAEGGGVRKFAEGGLLQYLTPQYWKDNPAGSQSWLTQQGRQNWANSPLGSSVNALGEKIVNDPLEAAGLVMMAHPAARGVSTVGKAGLKAASPTLLKMVQKSPQLLKNKKIRDALLLGGGAALAFAPDAPTAQQLRESEMLKELDAEEASRLQTPEESTANQLLTQMGLEEDASSLTPVEEPTTNPASFAQNVFQQPKEQKSGIDTALLAMGAKILASPGVNPLSALGMGIGTYLDVKTSDAKAKTDAAQQAFENSMTMAQKEINRLQVEQQMANSAMESELQPLKKQKLEAEIEESKASAALNAMRASGDPVQIEIAKKMAEGLAMEMYTPEQVQKVLATFKGSIGSQPQASPIDTTGFKVVQ
jgi:hypothetical protein